MSGIATIDLFAGAGGLSLGARDAGANVRLLVDSDQVSCVTARSNDHHRDAVVIQADVTALTGSGLRELAGLTTKEPVMVVGGPPCQPFSKAAYWMDGGAEARFRQARVRGEHVQRPSGPTVARADPRRSLVGDFWRLVREADAEAFLMENVPSILHPRNRGEVTALIDAAKESGYKVELVRANAAAFGVPQRRNRVFILGSKGRHPVTPAATHALDSARVDGSLAPVRTAGEVLAPFASDLYFEPEEVITGRWARHMRDIPPGQNYKFHTAWAGHDRPTWLTETRFWNFLLKLSPDAPSWTIAASPGPWTGPFHWADRRLRTPEFGALQGFPLDYEFAGSRRERVRQVGNAVPPPLAAVMVAALMDTMTEPVRRR